MTNKEIDDDLIEVITTCRLCLCKKAEYDIFSSSTDSNEISCSDMIASLFSFPVLRDARLPSKICCDCKDRVSLSYDFKIVVENSNKRLQCLITETDKLEELMNSLQQYKENNIKHEWEKRTQGDCSVRTADGSRIKDELHNTTLESDYDCIDAEYLRSNEDSDEDDDKPLVFVKTHPKTNESNSKGGIKQSKKIIPKTKVKLTSRVDENGKTKYLCDFCPKEFTDKSSRRRHRKVQHFGILYYCKICKKNYRSKTSHESYHKVDKNKTYQCPTCNEVFPTHYNLQSHKKTHSNQSEYICNVCGKRFSEKHLCMSHKRRVHDKERPHQCTYCSKTFFSSHSLKDHITTHTKVRRYDCKECGMLFTTSTILKEHEMRHTGNKEFACQFCEKRFYRKKDLTRHELIHTKSYEHQCSYCGLKFRRKDHLSTHERGVHNITKDNTSAKNEN